MAYTAFETGQGVAFSIAAITIDAAGVITVGTEKVFTAFATRCEERHTNERTNLRPMSQVGANWVKHGKDWTLVLTGLKRATGTDNAPLSAVAWTNDWAQIKVTTASQVRTYQGLIGELGLPIEREQDLDEITLVPIGTGAANPTIAAVP